MIEKEFDAIENADIEALVTNVVAEDGISIEYKEQLPDGADDAAREFLSDVSSFANAGGGDLIYGIREKLDINGKPTGIPEAAQGLPVNADEQKGRLENMLRDGIDPRIPSYRIKHLAGFPSGPVIIIRVLKSWASPHMVKFKNLSRFFARTSAGKYQLDVREIRASFLASESLADKISGFRSDRVAKILAGETPLPLKPGPKFVLHLLPVRAFAQPATLDLRKAQETIADSLRPMGPRHGRGPVQFNFKGLFCNNGSGGDLQTGSYVQLFRNGAVEAVCDWLTEAHVLHGVQLDQELVHAAPLYLDLQRKLDLGPPTFVAVSAVSVKSLRIRPTLVPNAFMFVQSLRPIEEDFLLAPEVLAEESGADIANLLNPAIDSIWQASGWAGSQGYENAKWVGYANYPGG